MTTREAFESSAAHLALAARTLSSIDPSQVPTSQREVLLAAIGVVHGVHRLLADAIPASVFLEPPAPRQAEATTRRGPELPLSFENWLVYGRADCTGPLVSLATAATRLALSARELREKCDAGELPLYDLGQGTLRTRLCSGGERDETQQVSAQEVAEYLGVDRKWVYNHIGQIPHWVLGSTKVFRLAEVDWFLETFRRQR